MAATPEEKAQAFIDGFKGTPGEIYRPDLFGDGFKGTPGEIYRPDLFGEELELNLLAGLAELYRKIDGLEEEVEEISMEIRVMGEFDE
jgi:hypothetical protein